MTCRPRHSICFLKTHKCASSSVQNLLMRYGDRNNLRFVLPPKNNYLGHPKHFNRRVALDYDTRRYDMLVHHSRFYEREMRAVLGPDPVFVTIVREPASLFESIFSYYALERKFGDFDLPASSAGRNGSCLCRKARGRRARRLRSNRLKSKFTAKATEVTQGTVTTVSVVSTLRLLCETRMLR
ncbi:conserved hypothetical protein [Ixodes scapularis]|uniref:Uncharacterized protein n=1 Tax=Ixodes scapularis TaxID=6945 RepID=B7P7Z3_IXOSC|nr:conserved hypothetical protein [Ixodes scapularis]|eukprot:XP_002400402.1 conserved hypothetical protein [Ixodes scapularis]